MVEEPWAAFEIAFEIGLYSLHLLDTMRVKLSLCFVPLGGTMEAKNLPPRHYKGEVIHNEGD